jgi:ribosomal protein S2
MKTQKVSKYTNKLIKLKLIQTKTYIKKQYINNLKLEDIQYRLKKIFYIIYKYHVYNKKILFIGTPFDINYQISNLLKTTNHIFVPNSIWIKGILSNKKLCFKHLLKDEKNSKNKISELLLKLKKNVDLIVILKELNNEDILNEGYVARIPVIVLNNNFNAILNKPSYKVPGNFNFIAKKIRDNLFYSMLVSVIKKADKYKNLFIKSETFKTPNQFYNKHKKKFNIFKKNTKYK